MGLETVKSEIHRVQNIEKNMVTMIEQFSCLMTKWDAQERDRKGKDFRKNKLSKFTLSSGVFPGCKGRSRKVGNRGEGQWRLDICVRRLEMPIFDGENSNRWVFRKERYFGVNQLSDAEKLEMATLCLDGSALAWYQWEHRRNRLQNWEEFKKLLLHRFRFTQGWTIEEMFLALLTRGIDPRVSPTL
ncbi:1-phosphatidylinositol-3-phosphate 5-kinase [Abeliophyllum distichum]|uniref:1-phosphatidylinositol-3-phosphate 5-kinase n=1 Tax=Abeliophyllum distichum TaxID=126358 RepID=A0ABD1QME5_9LAMI